MHACTSFSNGVRRSTLFLTSKETVSVPVAKALRPADIHACAIINLYQRVKNWKWIVEILSYQLAIVKIKVGENIRLASTLMSWYIDIRSGIKAEKASEILNRCRMS